MTAIVKITKAEAEFMAHVWGQVWAEDVKYGSGTALLPLMDRLSQSTSYGDDVVEFNADTAGLGISVTDAYGNLRVFDPEGFLSPDDADRLHDRLVEAVSATLPSIPRGV